MFGKKKHIQIEKITGFDTAIKAIKAYIYLQEWTKAKSALEDIKKRETDAFSDLEWKIKDNYKLVSKQRKAFDKKLKIGSLW